MLLILDMTRQGNYPNSTTFMKHLKKLTSFTGTCAVRVSKRTILRDISDLREMFNAPIEYDQDRNGYYLSDPDWELMKDYLGNRKRSVKESERQENSVSREKALSIVIKRCYPELNQFHITDKIPLGTDLPEPVNEPCWYVFPPPPHNGRKRDRTRFIAISKKTGNIIFDGIVLSRKPARTTGVCIPTKEKGANIEQ